MARLSRRGAPGSAFGRGDATAADIARFGPRGPGAESGDAAPVHSGTDTFGVAADAAGSGEADSREPFAGGGPAVARSLSLARTDALFEEDGSVLRRKVAACMSALAVLAFLSLGIIGATDSHGIHYQVFSPVDVMRAIWENAYNAFADATGLLEHMAPTDGTFYFAMPEHAGVIAITLVCAVLLSVSGMLYQNVFKNPIAGPGMLGVSSGVSLGMMLLTYLYGAGAQAMITERYLFCYGLGAAVLAFVILAGRKLSGRGKPYDIVTMLLIGMILSQLIGFVVQFITLFVMETDVYQVYITLTQMLVVDVSPLSWAALAVACAVSLAPVVYLRFRFNALAFDEQEVKLLGIDFARLRAIALICGAIMILAAQIHIGAVAMVSLVVPFLSRSWFGCEFRKQLIGNVCISTILLLVCRDLVDLIPFVGDGIGIGSMVSIMALPLFLFIMARHLRGWE